MQNENKYLIIPPLNSEKEIIIPFHVLNKFMLQNNIPPKIIVPVNSKLDKWWYGQVPRSKFNLVPLFINNASLFDSQSIESI